MCEYSNLKKVGRILLDQLATIKKKLVNHWAFSPKKQWRTAPSRPAGSKSQSLVNISLKYFNRTRSIYCGILDMRGERR